MERIEGGIKATRALSTVAKHIKRTSPPTLPIHETGCKDPNLVRLVFRKCLHVGIKELSMLVGLLVSKLDYDNDDDDK